MSASQGKQPGYPIDFVVLWVDGTDPSWQADFRRWRTESPLDDEQLEHQDDNGVWRYRENGLLRYWFRGVERFAPWVRRVHFVTNGQRPEWLCGGGGKLRLVSHAEFMPAECLPTFNSRAIQYCLNRIPDLAEHFVMFDDDMFLLRPVGPDLYFRGGDPVLPASLRLPINRADREWVRTTFNDAYEVNVHLDVPRLLWANWRKWFDPRALGVGRALSNFACCLLNGYLPVKSFGHLPLPHLKSTFDEIWRQCPDTVLRTCRGRFRGRGQISHWMAAAWNLAAGRFRPAAPPPDGCMVEINSSSIDAACAAIRAQRWPQVCLNDSSGTDVPGFCFSQLVQAMDSLLPDKSSFEED